MMRFFISLFCLGWLCLSLSAQTQTELLKYQDVSRIMQQIFDQHVDQHEMTSEILQKAFKMYIDQFDPSRTYLLESEVLNFETLPKEKLNSYIEQYRRQDFSAFTALNEQLIRSIQRAQSLRQDLYRLPLPNLMQGPSADAESDKKRPFAKSAAQLKERIRADIAAYLQSSSAAITPSNYKERLADYEAEKLEQELPYLGKDRTGQPLSQTQLENLFTLHILKALTASLDSHSAFFNPSEAYDMRVRLQKNFPGIGVVLKETPQGVVISRLVEGGPAARSGKVKVNDQILKINGKPLKDMKFKQVAELVRGPDGSSVNLTLKRPGQLAPFQINLNREEIEIQDDRVDYSYTDYGDGIIGKIVLHSFYKGDTISSEKDTKEAIETLKKKGHLKGLILDLRENSGGFLTQAVKVAGLFITNGIIVISKYHNGDEHVYRDMDNKTIFNGPFVVLTSRATASAAEIVAQALQDYGVALVVGDEHTYGKGTIQSQTVTDGQGTSYFKVTVGKYYTVSGKTPQIQGVKSDILVPTLFNQERIGEEYLDYVLQNDTIPAEYEDHLDDINPNLRQWYLRYYLPTLQTKVTTWTNLVPKLKEKSTKRIQSNSAYQAFLKFLKGERLSSQETVQLKQDLHTKDFAMDEAVDIVKDMIDLSSSSSKPTINPSKKL